jgi:acetolactate synthase-1/2/3 large subunit
MKNGFLGMVREHQHYAYDDNYSMVELKGDPDLSLIAVAYGMGYMKVNGNSDIDAELKEFFKDDESCLMEVRVDPLELVKF